MIDTEKLEKLAALPTEARETMRRQEWMPASLAIRMADAIEHLLAERAAVRDAVGNLNRLDEYGDVPLRHWIRRIDAALSDAPVSDAAEEER